MPIIDIPGLGDRAAETVCKQLGIKTQHEAKKLEEAKKMVRRSWVDLLLHKVVNFQDDRASPASTLPVRRNRPGRGYKPRQDAQPVQRLENVAEICARTALNRGIPLPGRCT